MRRVLIWVLLSSTLGVTGWSWLTYRKTKHSQSQFVAEVHSSYSPLPVERAAPLSPPPVQYMARAPGRFAYRLSNTSKTVAELMRDPRAVLLENALLDTTEAVNLPLPATLRSTEDPRTYIVQCGGSCDAAFRQHLAQAGATIIAYIPNNAFLVRADRALAGVLSRDPEVGALLPYEPYYKIKASLLDAVLSPTSPSAVPKAQPALFAINVLLFADQAQLSLQQFRDSGLNIISVQDSPFGTAVRLDVPGALLSWIARLPGVQEMERAHARVTASDLSRSRLGIAADAVSASNYQGLTGSNVVVNVNDLGVDATHPDLAGRVWLDQPRSGVDTNGHGTFVAGLIAGDGNRSLTVSNAPGSPMPPSQSQFRGLAPAASIFSISLDTNSASAVTDAYLQQTAASAGAGIANNSWHYAEDSEYDLGACSYDAAVRDALPAVSGAQGLLCVFAAGNVGHGSNDGTGGLPDTIQSPATAKNVITVGAIEQPRFVTNETVTCPTNGTPCQTNQPWLALTDSSNQVAAFSSRGNVGPGLEGPFGRFKPDLVAPGTFVLSARATGWDQAAYYSAGGGEVPGLDSDPMNSQALSNLNNGVAPSYRFESGTSLSAAEVSGTLALMQQFFQERMQRTNSPALMKALLINGARPISNGYDLYSTGGASAQGWGLIQLPNSLPAALTGSTGQSSALWFVDQSPVESLATGQQRTRTVSVAPEARNAPLRITLAWTDPPGNPIAGVKLVNDLDLIVTNLDTGAVFWGNDIPAGGAFNQAWQPGPVPNSDLINNVENVFLPPSLGSNYSVTVLGRRVSVNAVADLPAGVVQDYALVIAGANPELTNALTVTSGSRTVTSAPRLTVLTNGFGAGNLDVGSLLPNERIGGFDPLPRTNTIPFPGSSNAVITVGTAAEWNFYVFTNEMQLTNLVFLTFGAQALSVPSAGFGSPLPTADLDLYVSTEPGLTNLDPGAVSRADKSLGRGGTEMIVYSNATRGPYYVGVKTESLPGAEYGFLADASEEPFVTVDAQGDEILRGFPEPGAGVAGSAAVPARLYSFHLTTDTFPVRRVIVTNVLDFAPPSNDWQLLLSGSPGTVALHNYSANGAASGQPAVYDDSGEGDVAGALPSDGPGNLGNFAGQNARGLWLLTFLTTRAPLTNQSSVVYLERQPELWGGLGTIVAPGSCRQDYLFVPVQATNLTVNAMLVSGTGPLSLQVYPTGSVSSNQATLPITAAAGTGAIAIDRSSSPPLNPGLYTVRTCNLGSDPANVVLQASTSLDSPVLATNLFTSTSSVPLADDAVSTSGLFVTNTARILALEVGVRISHPRVSDLMLSLVAPDGARALLQAGRGGASSNGLGADLILTNTTPVDFFGGPQAVTNVFETGQTAGTILISYDFFSLPDDMRVFYQSNLLYDSGLVSFTGSTNLQYGPGNSTDFTIIMNEGGNAQSNTSWHYNVTTTGVQPLFLTFTENTNLTITPIKFAPSPFTNHTFAPADGLPEPGMYYLPETSLNQFSGKDPAGQWTLEVADTRAGATSPPPVLLSWQLALVLSNSIPSPVELGPGIAVTNLLGPGQIQSYEVDVPTWASFATNSLLSASAPVNVFLNLTSPPSGALPGDFALGLGGVSGSWIMRSNSSPPLVPGSRFYLSIQNTNAISVEAVLVVNFDLNSIVTLVSSVAHSGTNSGPLNSADFYRYVVGSNAVRVQFEINGPSSALALLARKGPPPPNLGRYDFISANPGTNDQLIVVYDYSRPVALTQGEWFLTVLNLTGAPATYSILATDFSSYGTNIVLSAPDFESNSVCLTWSSLPGVHYFIEGKLDLAQPQWTRLSPTFTASDFTTTECVAVPATYKYFRVSEGLALTQALPIIASVTSVTNGLLLQWSAPTNAQFTVQWTPSLVGSPWHALPGTVTSTNGTFLFLDPGGLTNQPGMPHFYRLEQTAPLP